MGQDQGQSQGQDQDQESVCFMWDQRFGLGRSEHPESTQHCWILALLFYIITEAADVVNVALKSPQKTWKVLWVEGGYHGFLF